MRPIKIQFSRDPVVENYSLTSIPVCFARVTTVFFTLQKYFPVNWIIRISLASPSTIWYGLLLSLESKLCLSRVLVSARLQPLGICQKFDCGKLNFQNVTLCGQKSIGHHLCARTFKLQTVERWTFACMGRSIFFEISGNFRFFCGNRQFW